MTGRKKKLLALGIAALITAGTVFGYAGSSTVQAAERGGVSLSYKECEIYDKLYDRIVRIASDGGGTGDMLGGEEITLSWTYGELGLSGSGDASAKTQALSALRTSLNRVRDALISECPYELYWFDKTAGYSYSYRNPKLNSSTVSVDVVSIKFAVSQAYQQGGDANKVSGAKAQQAEQTVSYAQEIIAKYRTASDYEKLSGYVQEICDLAVYDDTITENGTVPYGDPWQIMYVFDRNPNTKVVCEAYAKAFQYLCDGTDFDSPWIECHTVSGVMNGIIHMWNIVTMPDGGNYIVDPTNCDEGTLYAPAGGIFLQGGTGDVVNGYQVLGYPYYYDDNIIQAFGTGGVLAIASSAYASGTGAWDAGTAAQRSGQEAPGGGEAATGESQGAQEDGQQDSGSGESEDQNAEGDGSLTPEISEKSDQQDNKKKEDVSRSGKSPNTEDTVVQCLIWGAVLVTAGGTGTVLALRRRPRRSRSRRR